MKGKSTRRELLKATTISAAGLAGLGASPLAGATARAGMAKQAGPNERLQFAIIGVGGRGGAHVGAAAELGVVYALCDVDATRRAEQSVNHPDAHTFQDFREMLDILDDRIDAVFVATPDHTHTVAAAAALKMRKPVYCEKPLTRTVAEARLLAMLAQRAEVPTQMGNQGTASTALRKAAALIKSGRFGAPKEVHCWTNRPGGWWPQGVPRPEPSEKPATLDWNLWLGPAPERPYADGYHPFAWRGWWDFGSGALGDIGCHCMNLPFRALDLRDPVSIQAETSGNNRESFPEWSIVRYEFGEREGRPALPLTWYDGGKRPRQSVIGDAPMDVNGCAIVCEDATIYSPGEYGTAPMVVGGAQMPDIEVEESPGHFVEFARAIDGGSSPASNIPGYSGPLTETVVLGNLAVWADGELLEWDAQTMSVKGHPEYDALIRPDYRDEWDALVLP